MRARIRPPIQRDGTVMVAEAPGMSCQSAELGIICSVVFVTLVTRAIGPATTVVGSLAPARADVTARTTSAAVETMARARQPLLPLMPSTSPKGRAALGTLLS